jgi:hypothetical protein
LTQHLEVEAGWHEVAERSGGVAGMAGARWKIELIGGPLLAVTEGEGVIAGLRNVKKETYFGQYATTAQAGMG